MREKNFTGLLNVFQGNNKRVHWLAKNLLSFLLFFLSFQPLRAQITIQEATNQTDVNNLVNNVLLNSCINISNIQYTGVFRAIGSFNGTASNIGLNSGIILTNGRGNNAIGPNNIANRSTSNGPQAGDAQLTVLAGTATYDASILEFDFIPYSDTIQFDYVFASEEYNEYVGLFNDPVAFFITGPGYGTPTNIAKIPGTVTPVSINTINNGYIAVCPSAGPCVNCAYYFDNCGGTTVQYDGFTTPMTAFAVVQPCQQYHIKIAIADALDRIFDSAVLLKAGSFTAGAVADVALGTINNINSIYEGCDNGGFTFTRLDSSDNSLPVVVSYTISGTATNGTDYTTITTSITIPAGQNSTTRPINALLDGSVEGSQTVTISLGSSGCSCLAPPTVTLTILDNNTVLSGSVSGGDTICLGETITLTANAAGSQGPYTYSWNNGGGSGNSITVSPAVTTTYTVTISDACNGQTVNLTQTVSVIQAGFTVAGGSTQCLTGNSFSFTNTGSTAPGINHTWDFGDSSPTVNTVNASHTYAVAGTYTVTHTISNGTCSLSTTATVSIVGSPTALITGNNSFCTGTNTVLSAATSTPGSGSITSFQWQLNGSNIGGATSSTYTVSAAGNYTVVVTNSNACSTVSAVFVVTSSNSPTATITGSNSICAGNTTVLSSAGSVPGSGTISSYQWQLNGSNIGGATAATYSATVTGNYTVIITNSFGCSATSSAFNVTVNSNPVATITGNNSFCTGSTALLSAATSTAGSGTISSYQWQLNGSTIGGATATTYTAISAGNYTVVITNSNGCSTTSAIWIVTEFSNPSVIISSSTNVACTGNNNGTATAVASGGSGVYSYLWQPGLQTTASVNNLSAGINTITVTDGNGCTDTASVNILVIDNAAPIAICQNITVYLNPLGTASITGADINNGSSDNCGIAAMTVSPNTFDCNNLGDNTVVLTVTDGSGNSATCSAVVSVQYSNPPLPNCGNISAYISTVGTVSVSDTDIITNLNSLCGIASITLSQTNFDCSNLGANTVDLTVFYSSGDSASCSANINVLDTLNPIITNCPADIQITPNVAGCLASVVWTVPTISDNCSYTVTGSHLPADTFSVGITTVSYDVTDPSGNTTQCQFNIEVLSIPVSVSLQPLLYQCGFNISCTGSADGNIAATITGGCTPFQYLWDSGETTSSLNGLTSGNYQLVVTDANGGVAFGNITLTEPNPISITSTQLSVYSGGLNISCNGAFDGSINVDFSGGADCESYNYLWSGPGGFVSTVEDISGLAAGNYSLTVTDSNGCSHTENIVLSEPTVINITTTSVTDVTCFGLSNGAATVSVSGGVSPYGYLWSNGETTSQSTGLPAGNHSVVVSDANGCSDSLTIVIQQSSTLDATIQTLTDYNGYTISCNNSADGSLSTTVSGGNAPYSFLWSTNETVQTISNLSAGNYSVTITDNSGCSTSATIQLDATPIITSSFQIQNPFCNNSADGSAEIIVSGGVPSYSYLWSTGQTTQQLSNLTAGNYSVTVTDANGCTIVTDTSLTNPTLLDATVISVNDVSCFGLADGSAVIQITGGVPAYNFQWSNGSTEQNLQNVISGNYALNITDANGCSDTLSVTINQPAELTVTVVNPATVCPGTEVIIAANTNGGNGSYLYVWSGGQSGANISVFPQQAFTLNVTVTDGQGCTASYTNIPVTVYPSPSAGFSISQTQSCEYPVTILTVNNSTGATQYNWNDDNGTSYNTLSPVITYNHSGTFSIVLVAVNSFGCTDTASNIFTVYEKPVAAFSLSSTSGCPPLAVDFTDLSNGALQYFWNFGDTQTTSLSNPSHSYSETGSYVVSLVITGSGGCSDSITINSPITVFPVPVASFTWDYSDPYNPSGKILFTNSSQGAENYQWSFGDGNHSTETNPANTYQNSGNYVITLVAENGFGCTDTISDNIEPTMDNGLFVPNALISGFDGDVGLFLPKGRGLVKYDCSVFDKWGNLLWTSNKLENGRPAEGWDGRFNGQLVPQGAYIWLVRAVFENNKIWEGMRLSEDKTSTTGTITVLK